MRVESKTQKRSIVVACLIVTLLAGCGGGGGGGGDKKGSSAAVNRSWGMPELIETEDDGDAFEPRIAIDANGNAIAVWQQSDGARISIWANRYTAGAGWGVAELIETNDVQDAFDPRLGIDDAGNAIALWLQSDGVRPDLWANRYVAGVGWGAAVLLETDDSSDAVDHAIAVGADGDAAAVWVQSDGVFPSVWVNHYAAATGWGGAQRIDVANLGESRQPGIAIDANGNAIAVWAQSDGARFNVHANSYPAGGGWGAAGLIESDDEGSAESPQIAFDTDGNAIALWLQSDGTRPNLWSNRFSAGASWGVAEKIEFNDLGDARQHQLAIDAHGNAIALWAHSDGTRFSIWANRFDGADWGAAELIETDDTDDAEFPQLVFDSGGDAIAVWFQYDAIGPSIWANRNRNGSWGTAVLVETDDAGGALDPRIAIDRTGNAIAVWAQSDGARFSIWASRYD